VGVPAILAAGTLVVSPEAASGLRLPAMGVLLAYVPFLVLQMLTTALAEEPGWRDFALVRHQRQHGPLVGTLLLTDWGRENGETNPSNILSFVLFALLLSIFITWVFNRTRGSLPLAMLVHASNNNFASVMLFAVFTTVNPYGPILSWAGVVGFSAVDLVLVAATRGRLGYRPELLDEQPEMDPGGDPPVAREARPQTLR
jgi:uncharacterized protein